MVYLWLFKCLSVFCVLTECELKPSVQFEMSAMQTGQTDIQLCLIIIQVFFAMQCAVNIIIPFCFSMLYFMEII